MDQNLILDLDVFSPRPSKGVRYQGHVYPVRGMLDMTIQESLKVLRLEQDIHNATGYVEQMDRVREQLELVCPGLFTGTCDHLLPDGTKCPGPGEPVARNLTGAQLIAVSAHALRVAEFPQKTGEEKSGSDSATGSPSPVEPTGGAGT